MESHQMADAIAISTSKYIKTVRAKIDGRIYIVRKIGAGEGLDLSALLGELQKQSVEILNLRGKIDTAESDEKRKEYTNELLEGMKPFAELQEKIEEIYIGLFDDGEDGKYSKALVRSLGIDNTNAVYNEIMEKANEKSA